MRGIISLPFRCIRAGRFGLIGIGAAVTGLGLWLQINGVPPGVDPLIAALGSFLSPVVEPQSTVFGLMSKIGGVMALLGLLGMTLHDIAPAAAKAEVLADDPEPEPVFEPAAIASGSTWQERLAAKTAAPPPGATTRPARSFGSMLRLIVVGLVIVAFLAVLGATLFGYLNGGAPTTAAASSPAQAMIQAHLARTGAIETPAGAALALPFDLPKFDLATIVPWVKEQLALALAGDQAAMIALGSVVAGIFAFLLIIKIIFARRRGKARRVKVSQMSYN